MIVGIEKEIYTALITEPNTRFLFDYNIGAIKQDLSKFFRYSDDKKDSDNLKARKNQAIRMMGQILKTHEKEPAFEGLLIFLKKIETGGQFFDESLRDHLVHSFTTYIVGLYFLCELKRIQQAISDTHNDPIVWKLASLLHDIGYPVQILFQQTQVFFDKVKQFRNNHLPTSQNQENNICEVDNVIINQIKSIERLYRGENAFDLIRARLNKYEIDIDLKSYFYTKMKEGFIDHGILSSIVLLNLIDALYGEQNPQSLDVLWKVRSNYNIDWGRRCFDNQIVDTAVAISMHNILLEPIMEHHRIFLEKTPIIYLLALADNVQVWRRQSIYRKVYPPSCVKINFQPNEVQCTFNIPDMEKAGIKKVLEKKLVDNKLTIHVY